MHKNCGLMILRLPPYFCWQIAFYRHLPTSGRQNTVKKGPQPLFTQKAFVPLCIPVFSPIMAHHNISLRFRAVGLRVKKFQVFCRPAADSILMPPTFHIASLNRYNPKFSGIPQKLTWGQ